MPFFDRKIDIPNYEFKGRQFNSYTDITYIHPVDKHVLVFGFNAVYDNFNDNSLSPPLPAWDETRATVGGYIQDSFDITASSRSRRVSGSMRSGITGFSRCREFRCFIA